MKAYRNYPEGYAPSAGPFAVQDVDGDFAHVRCCQVGRSDMIALDGYASLYDSAQARELAAALIECADFIDRAAMTPADVAEETAKRR